MATFTSKTKIEFSELYDIAWVIEGCLNDIKILTGENQIFSEKFQTDTNNIWQLSITETPAVYEVNGVEKYKEGAKIYLKLLEYGHPTQTLIKYRCESTIIYEGFSSRKTKISDIRMDLKGAEFPERNLFYLCDNFASMKNVQIKCRIESEAQLVNFDRFGKKFVREIQNQNDGLFYKNFIVNQTNPTINPIIKIEECEIMVICKGAQFKINKYLLTAQSEVFSRMFENNLIETQNNQIIIQDFEPEIVQIFLNYLKTMSNPHEIQIGEMTKEIFKISHKYQIEDLKTQCEVLLCQQICLGNAIQILKLGKMYNSSDLENNAMKFITSKIMTLYRMKGFEELTREDPKLLNEIFFKFLEK